MKDRNYKPIKESLSKSSDKHSARISEHRTNHNITNESKNASQIEGGINDSIKTLPMIAESHIKDQTL